MKTQKKRYKRWIIAAGGVVVLVFLLMVFAGRFEGEKPQLQINLEVPVIGPSQEIEIEVADAQTGIRNIWIGLLQKGREITLLKKTFDNAGIEKDGDVHRSLFSIKINPAQLKIAEGDAMLRISARDQSWRNWGKGNQVYLEKQITIDTQPPSIEILSRGHYVRQGGTGFVIYRLSEPCPQAGVKVGQHLFPGHFGYFKKSDIWMTFFALDNRQSTQTPIHITAADYAGNQSAVALKCFINRKAFKKDIIKISDRFLARKLPDFKKELVDKSSQSAIEKFLTINREVRKANFEKIAEINHSTHNQIFWEEAFVRLPGSAQMAGFGDGRIYKYKGKIIDKQTHYGIDLASINQAPVPAANHGKVVFAQHLGIYGNTVIIDHGFGLFSMYAHMSRIAITPGQTVSRKEVIGYTGSTGLAGGDHLHYAMMVHDAFVNPVEWWDAMWIKHNVTQKIKQVEKEIG